MSLSEGLKLVLSDYLKDFIPHDEYVPERDMLLTSADIAFELHEMCELEVNDIVEFMAANGYRYVRYKGTSQHGWILERVSDIEDDD